MEPLGWDEIVSQPGMGGYLSFLNGPVPLPHLQGAGPALAPDPGVLSSPRIDATPEAAPTPEPHLASEGPQRARREQAPDIAPPPGAVSGPGIETAPEVTSSPGVPSAPGPRLTSPASPIARPEPIPDSIASPGVVSTPGVEAAPGTLPTRESTRSPIVINDLGFVLQNPEVVSIPAVPAGRIRIRRCAATHDGHSLGEEVLYQALWKVAQPESAATRTIVIGWRGMSQLCRMTPKNCKINTQRLIRKLALEVVSPYSTPESIGTTYRVYSDQAIFERRRKAGLQWVVRSRGVEFVDPATGASILPICAPTYQSDPPLI